MRLAGTSVPRTTLSLNRQIRRFRFLLARPVLAVLILVLQQADPAAAIEVRNVRVGVVADSNRVFVRYDLSTDESKPLFASLHISTDGGTTFLFPVGDVTGDLGWVSPGKELEAVWSYAPTELPASATYAAKIVARSETVVSVADIVSLVDTDRMRTDLESIEGVRHYEFGAELIDRTKDYIESAFRENGLQAQRQRFAANRWNAENLIGRWPGTEAESDVFIIDAHFDTVPTTPGADDNASGVIGMLEAMRVLSQFHFRKSIKFIGFDLEEIGLVGSREYVRAGIPEWENTLGVVNFEMIGYTCQEDGCDDFRPLGDYIHNIGDENSDALRNLFDEAAATYAPELVVLSTLATPDNPNFRRSDHARFWDAGIPALFLTDGANFRNPNYHLSSDISETLDFEFLTRIVRSTVGLIAEQAEPVDAGVGVSEPFGIDPTPARDSSWGGLKRIFGSAP